MRAVAGIGLQGPPEVDRLVGGLDFCCSDRQVGPPRAGSGLENSHRLKWTGCNPHVQQPWGCFPIDLSFPRGYKRFYCRNTKFPIRHDGWS